jgi:hypothetical protein
VWSDRQLQQQFLDTPQLADQPQLQLQHPRQEKSNLLQGLAVTKQHLADHAASGYQQLQQFDCGSGGARFQQQQQQQQQFMGAGGAVQVAPQHAGDALPGLAALPGQAGFDVTKEGAAAGWPSGSSAAAAAAANAQLGLAYEQPHVQQQQQQQQNEQQRQQADLEDSLLTITPSLDLLSLLNEPDSDGPAAVDATLAQALNVPLPQQQQQQPLAYQQPNDLQQQAGYQQQQQQQQRPRQLLEQRQDSAPLLQLPNSSMNQQQQQQQQQPVHLLQMLQAKQQQQQQRLRQQQPVSAFAGAEESAFASVQVLGSSSGGNRPLTAERSSSINVSRTVTGELPVLPPGFDASKQQALADAAETAVAAAAVDTGSPRDTKQQQKLSTEQQQQQDLVVLRHTRQITCKTYLKRLNVTQYMSDHLLPRMEGSLRVSSQKQQVAAAGPAGSSARSAAGGSSSSRDRWDGGSSAPGSHGGSAAGAVSDDDYDPSNGKGAAGKASSSHKGSSSSSQRSYEMLFKVQVKLVDAVGQIWPVTYEGVMCAGQRHLRLTCGWSEFIKAKRLTIGDAVTFERRGGNRTALAVTIARAGQEAEAAWSGVLPEDEQVKVLVGALRDGSSSPVGAPALAGPAAGGGSSIAAAAAGSGKRSGSAGGRSGSGGSDGGGSGLKPLRRQAAAAATAATQRAQLKKSSRQTSLKRSRARGAAGDDYDYEDRDWDADDAGSSGSGGHVDAVVPPCSSRVGSALLPHQLAAAASKDGYDMLRVASSEPWDAAAAAAASLGSGQQQQLQQLAGSGPVLSRPRSFTKRPTLNLDGMGSPRSSAPAGVSSMMLSPNTASAAGRAVVSGHEGPWAAPQQQQQQPWQDQEQQLQWQRQELPRPSWQQQELQPPALSSWNTCPAAAAAAAAPGGMEPSSDVPQQRRYNRQVSHPVARRELLAVQQDIAAAGNPAAQRQQQQQLQMPSGYGGAIMEEVEFGAAAAGLSGRSRLAAAMGLQQYQQQLDDMLRPAASVPVPPAAAAAGGSRGTPGWQVSTGFVGGGAADCYDGTYQQQQQRQQQQLQMPPPYSQGLQLPEQQRQGDVSPVGAACAADRSFAGRQQYQQQGYSGVPSSPAQQYAVPQGFQQQQQQVSLLNQHQLKREEAIDPRGLLNPQLLAPPRTRGQQQQLAGMQAGPQAMGLQAYDRPMQQQQQRQQMPPPFSQPLMPPPLPQQVMQPPQQQHYELQQAAPVLAAAPAADEWVEPAEEPNPFIQHQQREQQQQQQRLDAPDADQISVGAMESDTLVDTLLQLLAEPSVNMQQAPSLPLAISVKMASLTQEQQQELHQALQQEQQQRQQEQQQRQQQEMQAMQQMQEQQQQQEQLGQHGQVPVCEQAPQQQQPQWDNQAMQHPAQLQQQPPLPLQLLQQWQQQQQRSPLPWQAAPSRLAPPTLLPPEAVAAASQQLRSPSGSLFEASGQQQQQQQRMGFSRQ